MITTDNKKIVTWDEKPIDVTNEANFIWSIANKLRGAYMPDKYGDVIIPMVIMRRFECALEDTKQAVVDSYRKNPTLPSKVLCKLSGYQFYNTSNFDLKELCNDADHLAENFKSYIAGFSDNIQDILNKLEVKAHIDKMEKVGCLYSVVSAFSVLDLYSKTFDSIKMGYIFENLIGRFFQNVDAGQFYTGRDIIKLCVLLLLAEGCDDIFDDHKIITVGDQACGTGGMLFTADTFIKHFNPTADVRLFGQELMPTSYAIGLAEMLIKGQNAENFRNADSLKTDCFEGLKMRFLLENPPFGTPWSGKDAKDGQEAEVQKEYAKGLAGRWGAGLPSGGDSQLLFIQSAVAKMDNKLGRAAIISNASPLFTHGTSSGESQIRKYLLEQDLIEAIIQLPNDLFYNTNITTYIWLLSKNKRTERKGKIQLINASDICHKLMKPLGNKRNEFDAKDRTAITELYANMEPGEKVKIYKNTDFMFREYTIMQPLQRSYSITEESIERMVGKAGNLKDCSLIIETLKQHVSKQKYLSPEAFLPVLTKILAGVTSNDKVLVKVADGLSVMDKTAEIQTVKTGANKGDILYDKETKDTELVRYDEDIDDYMAREVLPYAPDAKWFFEEDLTKAKPVSKTGAEIPFTRCFYKFTKLPSSEEVFAELKDLDKEEAKLMSKLLG